MTGTQLEVAASNANTPPVSPEVIGTLQNAFKKDASGQYVVPEEQLNSAKKALLLYWGFPMAFVEEYASEFS